MKKNIGWALLFSAWFLHLGFCDWDAEEKSLVSSRSTYHGTSTDTNDYIYRQRITGPIYAKLGCPAFIAAIGGLVAPVICIAVGWSLIRGE